jgi:putative DNA primase/helicase
MMAEGKKVKGGPALAEFCGPLGTAIVKRLAFWLGLRGTDTLILDPSDTRRSARMFVGANYTVNDTLSLRRQAGVFYQYQPTLSTYRELAGETVRADLYAFLELAKARTKDGDLSDFKPTKNKVTDVLDAFNALTNLDPTYAAPRWLANDPSLNPLDILACPNGLLHIPTRTLLPPTPDFFTLNGIDCDYDPSAPEPEGWLTFLEQLWGVYESRDQRDAESIDTLQEIFGYLLCLDTHFQKIFSIIGPKRSGKSVIGRVMRRLSGDRNTSFPTLASLGDQFGKQPLVGKTLAIVGDARIGSRSDSAIVAEALLSISGEDPQSVQRKNLPNWDGKLSTRFLLLGNEPPKINDVSGALAGRFIQLVLTRSFYGTELVDDAVFVEDIEGASPEGNQPNGLEPVDAEQRD